MYDEKTLGDMAEEGGQNQEFTQAPEVEEQQLFRERFKFLFTKTGAGSVGDYVDHPLNFDGSQGMAQMIRGATGFFNDLDIAIIDIVVGFFRWRGGRINGANTKQFS